MRNILNNSLTKKKMRNIRKNLRNAAMITFLAAGIVFVGCNKDDDGINKDSSIIEAKNVIGVTNDVVKVMLYLDVEGEGSDGEIASADFKNGGFKIKLPKTIPAANLYPIGDWEDEGVVVSDKSAKYSGGFWMEIVGYDKNDDQVKWFELRDSRGGDYSCYVTYTYVDRNCTVKGNDGFEYFDCTFKKGWNIVYVDESSGNHCNITTTKPSGITYQWYCE